MPVAANGIITQPYVNGIVHISGNTVYGYSCVAPIIALTNSTPNEAVIHYAARAEVLVLGNAARLFLAPNGGQALLTNLLPGSIGLPKNSAVVTYISVGFDGVGGEFDLYALVFGNGAGYQLVPTSCRFVPGIGGETLRVDNMPQTCITPTAGVFPLEFCGCASPKWPWSLVYTASIGLACNNRSAVPSCEALAQWAARA
jgi:hypothetical protein